jgi:hypothetical protein
MHSRHRIYSNRPQRASRAQVNPPHLPVLSCFAAFPTELRQILAMHSPSQPSYCPFYEEVCHDGNQEMGPRN